MQLSRAEDCITSSCCLPCPSVLQISLQCPGSPPPPLPGLAVLALRVCPHSIGQARARGCEYPGCPASMLPPLFLLGHLGRDPPLLPGCFEGGSTWFVLGFCVGLCWLAVASLALSARSYPRPRQLVDGYKRRLYLYLLRVPCFMHAVC